MTIFDVGAENLPNVYIDKINLYDIVGDSYTSMSVKFLIKDHYSDRAWSGENQMFGKIKLKVLVVYDEKEEPASTAQYQQVTSNLNNAAGLDPLIHGTDLQYAPGLLASVGHGFDVAIGFENIDLEKDLITFEKQITFDINRYPRKILNLSIYACCYYDFDDEDFSNPLFTKFSGPVISEKVLINGQINRQSGYFYFPETDEVYGGPVHLNNELEFMEGSQHRGKPHEVLRFVEVPDFKIDAQDLIPLPEPQIPEDFQDPTASNLAGVHIATQTGDDSLISLCFVNLKASAVYSSLQAKKLFQYNPNIFNSLSSGLKLERISVYANQDQPSQILQSADDDNQLAIISTTLNNNVLNRTEKRRFSGTDAGATEQPFDIDLYVPLSDIDSQDNTNSFFNGSSATITQRDYDASTFLSSVYEINFLQNENIRTFLIKDSLLETAEMFGGKINFTKPQFLGGADASYTFVVEVSNTFTDYIFEVLGKLASSIDYMNDFLQLVTVQNLYDYQSNSYKQSYKQTVANNLGFGNIFETRILDLSTVNINQSTFMSVAKNYREGFNLLQPTTDDAILRDVFRSIFPFTGSPAKVEALINKFNQLIALIRSEYHLTAPTSVEDSNYLPPGAGFSLASPKSTDFGLYDVSLAYKIFSRQTPNTIHSLSKQQMTNRANYESKYYGNLSTPDDTLNSLSDAKKSDFLNISQTKMNHFTPFGIKNEDQLIDLTIPILQINSYKVLIFRLKKYGTLSDTTISTSGNNAETGMLETLGTVVDFTGTGTEDQEVIIPGAHPPDDWTIKMQEQFSSDFPLSEDELIISNSNSLIYQATIADNVLDLKEIPPHYKAMMLSNYGHPEYDVIQNTGLRRVIAETQMNLFKIYCIVGFETTNNFLNLTVPRVEPLSESILTSNKPYFCYSEPVNLRAYKFFNDRINTPAIDNFIYLDGLVTSPDNIHIALPDPNIDDMITFDDNTSYYTSNVVKQDPTKNGVLSLFSDTEPATGATQASAGQTVAPTNQTTGTY